ncbi:MAG: hypothetical protein O7F73_05105 [Gammaproteobacteria bacterium]|nr:hypothetical protein [Gammaproteobacteria bacterium]
MHKLFSRLSLAQRLAAICGGLCLLVALALALVGNLSSRYILQLQQAEYGQHLAGQMAAKTASVIGNGDLIGLEVTLEQLLSGNQLLGLSVTDLDGRQIGAAGSGDSPQARRFSAPIALDGNIAGEVTLLLPPSPAMLEQERMALGLFLLAILLSLFVTAIAASWAQKMVLRLRNIIDKLQIDRSGKPSAQPHGELELLEHRIASLPLELLKSSNGSGIDRASYRSAGLLYIRLNSLVNYVETLDESSLLRYTEFQHRLVNSACELYQGELSVVRQFGLLVSFSGHHPSGSPVFRAASAAWMVQQLLEALQSRVRLRLSVSMACGISEAGAACPGDIYPGLYCQHVIDELAALVASEPKHILLSEAASKDEDTATGSQLDHGIANQATRLQGFAEPYLKLLERQQQILISQLLHSVQGI